MFTFSFHLFFCLCLLRHSKTVTEFLPWPGANVSVTISSSSSSPPYTGYMKEAGTQPISPSQSTCHQPDIKTKGKRWFAHCIPTWTRSKIWFNANKWMLISLPRDQSLFISWLRVGGLLWGITWFSGEQLSLTECKEGWGGGEGGMTKITASKGRSLEYYKSYQRYQVNFILTQSTSAYLLPLRVP